MKKYPENLEIKVKQRTAEKRKSNGLLKHEIEERQRIEIALRDSEARAQTLIKYAPTGILSFNYQTQKLINANDAMSALSGYTHEELLSISPADIMTPESKKLFLKRIKSRLKGESIEDKAEYTLKKKDGTPLKVIANISFPKQDSCTAFIIIHDITERVKIEEEGRASRKKFQDLVETTGDFIWEIDTSGKYTYCSPQMEKLWGIKPDKMIGRTPFDSLPPAYRQREKKLFIEMTKSPRPLKFENISKNIKGETVYVEISGVPFFDPAGRLLGYRGITRDITEHKKARDRLIRSEERLRLILDSSRDVITQFNLKTGKFEYVSPAAEKVLGYSPDFFLSNDSETTLSIVHPDDLNTLKMAHERAISTGSSSAEYRQKTKKGGYIWISNHMSVSKDDAGIPFSSTGNLRDITAQKLAEEALKFERDKLTGITNAMRDAIVIINTDYSVEYINPSMELLFGKVRERRCYDYYYGRDRTCPWCKMKEVLSGKIVEEEIHLPAKDRAYAITHVLVANAEGKNSKMSVWHDVTDYKKAEKIKDEFIGMVSHEIRTPLTVIIGALNVSMAEGISREEVESLLNDALSGAENLNNILNNMIELARIQSDRLVLQKERLDIKEIIISQIKKQEVRGVKRRLIMSTPERLPRLYGDRTRLEMVLTNLIDNAVKYSDEDTEIKISANKNSNNLLEISVEDQGIGISTEHQLNLFQPFERIDNSEKPAKGLGLGLMVCKRLVEAHQGRIWVESRPGKGTIFHFTLPVG